MLHIRREKYIRTTPCVTHQTDLDRDCFIARGILGIPSIAGTWHSWQIALFTTVNGRLSSSRKINFRAQKWVYRARSTWEDVIVLAWAKDTVPRTGDTTALIFYSALLYIVVSTTSYIVSEMAPWKSRNCSLPFLPLLQARVRRSL